MIRTLFAAWAASAAVGVASAQEFMFETQVRPLLKAHCFECHGEGAKAKGGLDLRLARFAKTGGDSGPAIVEKHAAKSLLVERVRSGQMPPGKRKLTREEIDLIVRWIDAGAPTAKPEPATLAKGFLVTDEDRAFWAFQPIRKTTPPANGASHPIDAYLIERLKKEKLGLSPEADRVTLIRRATFDLHGLPPTPEEVDAFVNDRAADAWERLLDRLLASPRYGERWARHWLDAAGYADSEGFDGSDVLRASAYRYRDYVIRSLNADKPFDRFLHEQLAGDEMLPLPLERTAPEKLDLLIATGFLRMAPDGTASKDADPKVASNQAVADTIHVVSSALLGLTVQCAQCHNHRYDPISQTDYYRLRAVFEPALNWKAWKTPTLREVPVQSLADKAKADALEKDALAVDKRRGEWTAARLKEQQEIALAKAPADKRDALREAFNVPLAKRTAAQKKLLSDFPNANVNIALIIQRDKKLSAEQKVFLDEAAAIRAKKPAIVAVRALTEPTTPPPPTHLFERGDFDQPRELVAPGHLSILGPLGLPEIPVDDPALPTTGRRLAFAKALTSPQNPLTARALVNRFWMHHFGKGLVGTTGDFGKLGETPSHPELLDWLASAFVADGWSLKAFHKRVMTSAAYRQSSVRTAELQRVDPDNRLLGRMSVRRLEAEAVRDATLAVAGSLNPKAFGPPIPVTPDEFGQTIVGADTRDAAGRFTGKSASLGGEELRRSIYVQVRRSLPLSVLETFDAAMVTPNCEQRAASTVAPQSLLLLNSRFVHDQSEQFARRLQKEAGPDIHKQIARGWRLALGTTPSLAEVEDAARFVAEQTDAFRRQKLAPGQDAATLALANYCQALVGSNAFLYVD